MKMSKAFSVLEAGKGLVLELGHPELCLLSAHCKGSLRLLSRQPR